MCPTGYVDPGAGRRYPQQEWRAPTVVTLESDRRIAPLGAPAADVLVADLLP